jgi:hypothetical protein
MKKSGKKIGILTLNILTNYGGILQCYALMAVLKNEGHEVWYIDKKHPNEAISNWLKVFKYSKRFLKRYLMNDKKSFIFLEKKMSEKNKFISQNTSLFINKYIQPKTKSYIDPKKLTDLNNDKFDACIVGSDQVWRPIYAMPIENFFFDFIKIPTTRKIAYAASFGVGPDEKEFNPSQIKNCGELIEKFDAISVREKSGIEVIKETYNWKCKEPVFVLDPTMLLTVEDYIKLTKAANTPKSKGELFYYVLDLNQDKQNAIDKIETVTNYKQFTVYPESTSWEDPLESQIVPPVESWIQAFVDAKFVIADSFHGTVFSILFNKPFIVYGNKNRGLARFDSLLNMFNLKHRYVEEAEGITDALIKEPIDWENVNKKIEEMKTVSMRFLLDSLK